MSLVMLVQQTGSGLQGRLGYSSALSVALFVVTIGPLLLVAYINNRGDAAVAKEGAWASTSRRTSRRSRPRRSVLPPRGRPVVTARTARRAPAGSASPRSPV